MKKLMTAALLALVAPLTFADNVCFESRENASIKQTELNEDLNNVECSDSTDAVLLWNDPYDGTEPMQDPGVLDFELPGEAVVKPRTPHLLLYTVCGTACHNGTFPPKNDDKHPRTLVMHQDVVPDALSLQHGRGSIWCLDCHHPDQRNMLMDNFGSPVSFNEPQKLCGKCHGPVYRDWRDGLHGKRIGDWASDGKKRWWVCTECHNPHDVQHGIKNSGFAELIPERAPLLPKGLENADHEKHSGH